MSSGTNQPIHQMRWVVLSASADQAPSRSRQVRDSKLIFSRDLNKSCPTRLVQRGIGPHRRDQPSNTAVLVIGELRCFERCQKLVQDLSKKNDLFIATSKKHKRKAEMIANKSRILLFDDTSTEKNQNHKFPHRAMLQWQKLQSALELVCLEEKRRGKKYSSIIKMRTDYYYVHPKNMIDKINEQLNKAGSGMIGASDKTFAGSRDNMMLLRTFANLLKPLFYNRSHHYLPINVTQVINSDVSCKWYGMKWPVEIIGKPQSIEDLWKTLKRKEHEFTKLFDEFVPKESSEYISFFEGDNQFASEISFAYFLNAAGIPFNDCISLRGFLYSDRGQCQ